MHNQLFFLKHPLNIISLRYSLRAWYTSYISSIPHIYLLPTSHLSTTYIYTYISLVLHISLIPYTYLRHFSHFINPPHIPTIFTSHLPTTYTYTTHVSSSSTNTYIAHISYLLCPYLINPLHIPAQPTFHESSHLPLQFAFHYIVSIESLFSIFTGYRLLWRTMWFKISWNK